VLALHWGSLDGGMLFSEARWSQRVDLACSHLSFRRPAPIAAASITYRTSNRSALLELNSLTGPPEVWGHVTTDGQSVSMSWRRAHLGTCDQILILSEFRCVVPRFSSYIVCRNSPQRVTWLLAESRVLA
jgi:hypothetical protein